MSVIKEFAGDCPEKAHGLYRTEPWTSTLSRFQRSAKLVFFCLLAMICQGLPAASIFVAKTGNDTNPGTEAEPFLTVKKGVSTAQPGDTVFLGAGRFEEIPGSVRSGSPDNYITIDGQGVASLKAFSITHAYICLRNSALTGQTNRWTRELYLGQGASYALISNNIINVVAPYIVGIDWQNPSPPFGEAASNCRIVNNEITGVVGKPALSIFGTNNLIQGNYIHDLGSADFVQLWGISNTISQNTFSNIFTVTGIGYHPDFIQTFGVNGHGSKHHTIEGNLVTDIPAGQFGMLEGHAHPEIRDWLFCNNVFARIGLQGVSVIPGILFYNNTFYRCNISSGGHALVFGSRSYTADATYDKQTAGTNRAERCRVLGNVFLDCGDSRNTVGWYYFNTNLVDVAADYNYVGKLGHKPVKVDSQHRAIGAAGGWDYMCMAWWEPHGINGGDPLFFSESKLDFRLQDGSPLLGAALPQNQLFKNDMRGTPRGSLWDIGPLEYQVGASPPAPPRNLQTLPSP